MGINELLKSVHPFSVLNAKELEKLLSESRVVEFREGESVMRIGDIQRHLYLIYDGSVRVMSDGDENASIKTLKRGDIFGEMSLLTGEPSIYKIIALNECRIIRISEKILSFIIGENEKFLNPVNDVLSSLFRERHDDTRLLTALSLNNDPYDLAFTSTDDSIKILVINTGSSSLKYSLFDTSKNITLFTGLIENIGSAESVHKTDTREGKEERHLKIDGIGEALSEMVSFIKESPVSGIGDISEISAVGHRVVHGGEKFSGSVVLTDDVITSVKECSELAPLHNPYNLAGIEEMRRLLPSALHVAVFDTAFHQSMPERAFKYAIPGELYEKQQIRRYGFHGSNHKFVCLRASMFLKRPLHSMKLISCHLGNGVSLCAIERGGSVDTSMGMTPLEGLVMGTRSGDIDPGIVFHLMRTLNMSPDDVDKILNKKSGLLGVSGKSNDMRELFKSALEGDIGSKSAINIFCYRVRKYIGSYMAVLGDADALIFTAGIGENSSEVRARICNGLESFGIHMDHRANRNARPQKGEVIDISKSDSKIRILVIPADEERMIARETLHAARMAGAGHRTAGSIPFVVQPSHVHLSRSDFTTLFGNNDAGKLPVAGLQTAFKERVRLIGPGGEIDEVAVSGSFRDKTQVEVSSTDEFRLGIMAPLRDAGDLEGTPGLTIEGSKGAVKIKRGVIRVRKHIHISVKEALMRGLKDRDIVTVRTENDKNSILGDILVKVWSDSVSAIHIDKDEALALNIKRGDTGDIESIRSRLYM